MARKPVKIDVNPKLVAVEEAYVFTQEISAKPDYREEGTPAGKIKIEIPYDDPAYFPEETHKRIKKNIKKMYIKGRKVFMNMGKMCLPDNDKTKPDSNNGKAVSYKDVPLNILVAQNGDELYKNFKEDHWKTVLEHEYTPNSLNYEPAKVDIQFTDEDLFFIESDLNSVDEMKSLAKDITEQVKLQPFLIIKFRVSLQLPKKLPGNNRPVIKSFSLKWPNLIPNNAIKLHLSNREERKFRSDFRHKPIACNPQARCLEWANVLFRFTQNIPNRGYVTYESEVMYLEVTQLAAFHELKSLEGEIKIDVPGVVLSNLTTWFTKAKGDIPQPPEEKMESKITLNFILKIRDEIRRRLFFPFQQFQFDEVMPEEMRITNIREAIMDRGFRIVADKKINSDIAFPFQHLLHAVRPEGQKSIHLWVYAEGKPVVTKRKSFIEGGKNFTSNYKSGTLKICFRGVSENDCELLLNEMNAIQKLLHECYECIRARR